MIGRARSERIRRPDGRAKGSSRNIAAVLAGRLINLNAPFNYTSSRPSARKYHAARAAANAEDLSIARANLFDT